MMTDGIYDAPGYAVNKELWMKRMIQEVNSEDPQEIADCLLEKVIRYQQNQIHDDMTVVVGRVDHFHPEWSNVHVRASPEWSGRERLADAIDKIDKLSDYPGNGGPRRW